MFQHSPVDTRYGTWPKEGDPGNKQLKLALFVRCPQTRDAVIQEELRGIIYSFWPWERLEFSPGDK